MNKKRTIKVTLMIIYCTIFIFMDKISIYANYYEDDEFSSKYNYIKYFTENKMRYFIL